MFIQIVSMIRTNSYIVYRDHFKKEEGRVKDHKTFTLEFCAALMKKAKKCSNTGQSTNAESSQFIITDKIQNPNKKRRRVCLQTFDLDWPSRFEKGHHRVQIKGKKIGTCIWCSKEKLEKRQKVRDSRSNKADWSKETGRTHYVCKECTEKNTIGTACFICKKHMHVMHPNGHATHQ